LRNFEKINTQDEMLGESRRQHWNKEPRHKETAAPRKQDNDLQEDFWAGIANLPHFETEKEIAHGVRAGNVGPPATLGSSATTV
jgi:hypothetical protein